jgi:hypothetical protein
MVLDHRVLPPIEAKHPFARRLLMSSRLRLLL